MLRRHTSYRTEHERMQQITVVRLRLLEFATTHSLDDLLEKTIDEAELLSGSSIGFYHFVDNDQDNLTLENWSTRTKREFCKADGKGAHYPIAAAGVWVDSVAARRPVVHNDYAALTHRKGMPEGHAEVVRELVVPVLRGDKIKAILGVGNKVTDYDEDDVKSVSLLADLAWDIAEHKLAEAVLQESEQRFRTVADFTHDWEYWMAPDGRLTYVSPSAERVTGHRAEEFEQDPGLMIEIVHADDREMVAEHIRTTNTPSSPEFEQMEFRILRGEEVVWLSHRCRSVLRPDGTYMGRRASDRDITDRRQFREEREQYFMFFQLSSEAMCIADPFGCFKLVNPAFLTMTGYEEEELTSRPFLDFVLEEDRQRTADEMAVQVAVRPSLEFENRYVRKNGEIILLSWNAYFDKTDGQTYAVARDITERKRTEDALRESEARFRRVVETVPAAIRIYRGDRMVFANEANSLITGLPLEEVLAPGFLQRIVHPEELRGLTAREAQRLRDQPVKQHFDNRIVREDGQVRWVENDVVPIIFDGGPATLSVSIDVTERKMAEEALRESRALFQAIIDGTTDAIFVKDLQGRYIMANAAASQAIGRSVAEILGKDDYAFFSADEADAVAVRDHETMALGATRTYEETVTTADGQLRTFLATKGPVFDISSKVVGLFGVCRDITDRKRMEAALLQSEKLESLGELSGGLAHDFNNLLTVILGNSALAAGELTEDSPALEPILEIEEAGKRGAELARLLLAASGREYIVAKPVDLNALGEETVRLLTPSFGARKTIECVLMPNLPLIQADASQVQRVLSSIIVNAAEALGDADGHIVLATGTVSTGDVGPNSQFQSQGITGATYVYVDVVDDGPGMDPDILAKVFDPFFTTKFAGRGLGLSAAQGIVHAHEGAIRVSSVPGRGTRFRVMFPAATEGLPDPTPGDRTEVATALLAKSNPPRSL